MKNLNEKGLKVILEMVRSKDLEDALGLAIWLDQGESYGDKDQEDTYSFINQIDGKFIIGAIAFLPEFQEAMEFSEEVQEVYGTYSRLDTPYYGEDNYFYGEELEWRNFISETLEDMKLNTESLTEFLNSDDTNLEMLAEFLKRVQENI